jgi:thiol:disulfide interchange protein DsbD
LLHILFSTLLLAWSTLGVAMANTLPVRVQYVETHLLADHTHVAPGQTFQVAWRLVMDPGWHVYWKNPGDSGLPGQLDWSLPEGFTADALDWPTPHPIATPPIMNYGYKDEVLLVSTLEAPETLQEGRAYTLSAHAGFLMCADICLPGEADLAVQILGAATPQPAPDVQRMIAERAMPEPLQATAWQTKEGYVLSLPIADLPPIKTLRFMPATEGVIMDMSEQPYRIVENAYHLTLEKDAWFDQNINTLNGVLLVNEKQGMEISAPLSAPPAATASPWLPLLAAILFAFLAGLILNLMPCVLPVLAIKVLSLIKQAHGRPWHYALAYTGGVLSSFWGLGGLVLLLKLSGQQLGWGFHLQSPLFVGSLTVFLTLMALNFFGVLSLRAGRLASLENIAARHHGMGGAFLSGVLVTLVATPCTVPFMGSAMAYALTAPLADMLAVFSSMALGLAAPFILLSLHPGARRLLPKPGPWMNTFKRFLGFPILATALWLGWVFGQLTSIDSLAGLLGLLLLMSLAAWLWSQSYPRWGLLLALAVLAGSVWFVSEQPASEETSTAVWESWSEEKTSAALAQNRPVFINATADWCLTCKVVEHTLFKQPAFVQLMKTHNVLLLEADWTKRDDAITGLLQRYGRQGVPLYLVQLPGQQAAQVLPQLPTLRDFEQALSTPPASQP